MEPEQTSQNGSSACGPCGETYQHVLVFSSHLDHCSSIAGRIVTLAREHQYSDEELFSIELALDEALTNAVRHGNSHDPAKTVRVEFSVTEHELRVRITDEGIGFDPQNVPDPRHPERLQQPGGRGVMLMQHYMCGVRYVDGGNCVEMWKKRLRPS